MKTFFALLFVLLTLLPASGQEYAWTTLAGKTGGPGSADGTGGEARFYFPAGVAADANGNLYVADRANHTIRKITPGGAVTTLAGKAGSEGSANGTGAAARFSDPSGVVADAGGNIYVADRLNHTIRKITPAGVVTTLAGLAGSVGHTDGTGTAARFRNPAGVAADTGGNVYVADTDNNIIRKITPAGVVTTLAGQANFAGGSADGAGPEAQFHSPHGVAADGSGNIYVADANNHTIRKITALGVVTTLGGQAGSTGSADGTGDGAQFRFPFGVTADETGNVYAADFNNHTIRKITPAGVVTTLAGVAESAGNADGTGSEARFYHPSGVASDGNGNVYAADSDNNIIRKIAPEGEVTTLAGLAGSEGSIDGTGGEARFLSPYGVAADEAGNIYVTDGNSTIRKITPAGAVATLAGLAGSEGSVDGTGSEARFRSPSGAAVDTAGNVYVAEFAYHTIRRISPAGVVTTPAGLARHPGSADGTVDEALFFYPTSVAVDGSGNVYVADNSNHTIRKITPGGMVTTLAGKAGSEGSSNGMGAAARFRNPVDVAVDGNGNVYVADFNNHTIRKITPGGTVTTLAGRAGSIGSADGTGGNARFNWPNGVAVDGSGNVYVAEYGNYTIRKITPAGVVTTVGGKAGVAGGTDGTGAAAQFASPTDVAVDRDGNLFVADSGNNTIRRGLPGAELSAIENWRQFHFSVTENSGDAADGFDSDGDGLVNLVEFAFGLDPKAASSAQLPPWRISGGKLSASFPAPAGVSGIAYGAEWSTSLTAGNWTPVSDEGTAGAHAFSVPVEGHHRLFVRFKIAAAP